MHETGYRHAWIDLHRAVTEGATPRSCPDDAIADLELTERILRLAAGLPEEPPALDGPPIVSMGSGVWSGAHLALAVAERMPVLRVASRRREQAEARAWLFGAEGVGFEDPDAALEGAGAAVVVGVPAVHEAHTVAALEKGIPVLVEKPLAKTLAEARRIVEAADRTGTRCVYAENWVFQPIVRAALDALGGRELQSVKVSALHPSPGWGSFTSPDYGGGVLFDLGAHPIELARLLLGRPDATSVSAELVRGEDVECDVEARVHIDFAGGKWADIEATWTSDTMLDAVEADGLSLTLAPEPRLIVDGEEVEAPTSRGLSRGLDAGGYRAQIRALLGDAPIDATVHDGLAVMEIIAAAYRSAATGQLESLPFTGNPDATPHDLWADPGCF